MREKNLEVCLLLDFYGQMLTEKQREIIDLYYNEDLSLAEIAAHMGITRQGVRDHIKRGEAALFEIEKKLGLASRFGRYNDSLAAVLDACEEIRRQNRRSLCVKEIEQSVDRIVGAIKDLS